MLSLKISKSFQKVSESFKSFQKFPEVSRKFQKVLKFLKSFPNFSEFNRNLLVMMALTLAPYGQYFSTVCGSLSALSMMSSHRSVNVASQRSMASGVSPNPAESTCWSSLMALKLCLIVLSVVASIPKMCEKLCGLETA